MSAEGATLASSAPVRILADQRSRRIVRFALGTTIGSGFAYLIGFELPFLVPILIAMLLASPAPRPTLRTAAAFVVPVAAGAFVGVVLTRYFLQYEGIFLLIEFLVTWFHANSNMQCQTVLPRYISWFLSNPLSEQ